MEMKNWGFFNGHVLTAKLKILASEGQAAFFHLFFRRKVIYYLKKKYLKTITGTSKNSL